MTTDIINYLKGCNIDVSKFNVKEKLVERDVNGEHYVLYFCVLYPLEPWPEDFDELLRYRPLMYSLSYVKNDGLCNLYKVSDKRSLIAAGTFNFDISK